MCPVPSDRESAHHPWGDAGCLRVSVVSGLSDETVTEGAPEVRAGVSPGRQVDQGAMATVVRPVLSVVSARPGLLTISYIVPVAFRSGDLSRFVSRKA